MEWFSGNIEKFMRIGIDISQTIFGTGVSVYTKNLVKGLMSIDNQNQYILYGGSLRRFSELQSVSTSFKGNSVSKIYPYPPFLADLIWNKLHVFPIEKLIGHIDVLHTSDWTEPPTTAFKVTTVHDLYPLKFPKLIHPKILEVHKRKLSWVVNETKRVIVPSESTKKDLMSLGVEEGRIRIIPEAPTLSRATDAEIQNAKKEFGIQGDYLISIGVTQLKNTKRIIEAFHLARAGQDLKMVIVGSPTN